MGAATGPGAKCPGCGQSPTAPLSIRSSAGTASPYRAKAAPGSRLKLNLVIALTIAVLLISLWRLMTRPEFFGSAGAIMRTNVFGSFGIRLAQSAGIGIGGGDAPADSPDAPAETNSNPIGSITNATPATSPVVTAVNSNQNPGVAEMTMDDTLITNRSEKVIVSTATDINNTSEPATNSPDAAALAQRLGAVGAKTGDIEFSLSWNNVNDLDLHCIDPRGVEIWFENTNSVASGGLLDHDANAHDFVNTPVENIYWPVNGAPPGNYQVFVVYYARHGGQDPTRFTLRTLVKDQTNYFTRAISYTDNQQKVWVCTVQYDPANPDAAKRRRFLNPRQTR